MLKIAMLSGWHVHAKGYAQEFEKCENVKITAVWDEDKARGQQWAEELGCDFEPDLATVLARDDVDAVSVGTPTTMHKEVICAAAAAKKAIFTEKVLATTNADALAIKKAVNDANVPFSISLRRRTEPRILHTKKLIENGILGEITLIRIRDAHDGGCSGWLPDSFYDISLCGGGAMMDLGAHPMYLLDYFLGAPKAITSVFTEQMHKGADDNCVSVLTYGNGAIGIAETGFVSKSSPFSVEICGKLGHLYLSDEMDGILITNENGKTHIATDDFEDIQITPATKFANALNSGIAPPFPVEDGVNLTTLMDGAYRAAKEGKTIIL